MTDSERRKRAEELLATLASFNAHGSDCEGCKEDRISAVLAFAQSERESMREECESVADNKSGCYGDSCCIESCRSIAEAIRQLEVK